MRKYEWGNSADLTNIEPVPVEHPERDRYLLFCSGAANRAGCESMGELDDLLHKCNYATPEYVPDRNIGVVVENLDRPERIGHPNREMYRIRVAWHFPAGCIVHDYLFRLQGLGSKLEIFKNVDWCWSDSENSPERTIGDHSTPYASDGEIQYLEDLLERSYERHVATSKHPPQPSMHSNPGDSRSWSSKQLGVIY